MGRLHVLFVTGSLLTGICLPAVAQDHGYWKATSNTARSITGDLSLSEDKLTIAFSAFTIAQIRSLQDPEILTAFNTDSGGTGTLYRLNIPAKKVFLHKTPMCGTEDTQWMATYVNGKTLQLAFFSGSKMPEFTPDAFSNSTALCGTFTYGK